MTFLLDAPGALSILDINVIPGNSIEIFCTSSVIPCRTYSCDLRTGKPLIDILQLIFKKNLVQFPEMMLLASEPEAPRTLERVTVDKFGITTTQKD